MLLSQEHIKERRKQRKCVRFQIRKGDSKRAYYSITKDLSLADKDFRKHLRMNTLAAIPALLFYLNKNWNYVFTLFLYCTSRNYLSKNSLPLLLVSVFASSNSENMFCTSATLLYFTQQNNVLVMNKIKLVWFKISKTFFRCYPWKCF